jgi:hypothetical protein
MTAARDAGLTERGIHDSLHDHDIANAGTDDVRGTGRRSNRHIHRQLDVSHVNHAVTIQIARVTLSQDRK